MPRPRYPTCVDVYCMVQSPDGQLVHPDVAKPLVVPLGMPLSDVVKSTVGPTGRYQGVVHAHTGCHHGDDDDGFCIAFLALATSNDCPGGIPVGDVVLELDALVASGSGSGSQHAVAKAALAILRRGLDTPPASIRPEEKAGYGQEVPCKGTDLVVFVLVVRPEDALILLVEERNGRGYFLPAGHIEKGESMVDASRRECLEETGLMVEPTGLYDIVYGGPSYDNYPPRVAPIHYFLTGHVTGGELKTTPDHESDGAGWFPLQEVVEDVARAAAGGEATRKYRKPWELNKVLQRFTAHHPPVVIPIDTPE